ncbi:MAG: SGNH/GDSL hydrolase family protein [Myxococcota bacterium]|nr:SGNH/GDSL hydrolase family protein [Myxococcota bacterium]
MKRLSLSLLAGLFAILLLETIFRVRFPVLPSLSALQSPEAVEFWGHDSPPIATSPSTSSNCQDPPGETRAGSAHVAPPVRRHVFGDDNNARPNILVAGDSIAWGYGVEPTEAWGAILGQTLHQSLNKNLSVSVVGIPGGGYCEILRGIHRELDAAPTDVVVLQVFADDLEQRAMMVVDGAPLVYPAQATHPTTRTLASHSYVFNWVWAHWSSRNQSTTARFISTEGQNNFQQAMSNLKKRTDALDIQLVAFQIQPAGLKACSETDAPACGWYHEDHSLMTQLLGQAGIQALDLSAIWDNPERWVLEKERMRMQREPNYVAIHPNKQGHALLASALAGNVESALTR